MPAQYDPDDLEIKYLRDIAELSNAQVLEIGCGDGRLTWRYAATAGRVIATDPDPKRLAIAAQNCPPALQPYLSLVQTRVEALPFPPETFDLALLAWSL